MKELHRNDGPDHYCLGHVGFKNVHIGLTNMTYKTKELQVIFPGISCTTKASHACKYHSNGLGSKSYTDAVRNEGSRPLKAVVEFRVAGSKV